MSSTDDTIMDPGQKNAPRILIVDDDPANISMVRALLESEGYELTSAESGKAALESVAEQIPDLILLDIQMPDMDGYEVCDSLHNDPETKRVPVVMFTATESASEARGKGLLIGANDYVTRPIAKEELLARIETQLRLRDLEDQRIINPLTGILGHTEVLLDRMSRKVVPLDEIEKALRTIWDESRRIQEVMTNLKEVTMPVVEEYSAGTSMIDIEES